LGVQLKCLEDLNNRLNTYLHKLNQDKEKEKEKIRSTFFLIIQKLSDREKELLGEVDEGKNYLF
jgi:hypothetical protein